ncbi:hypothetical protein CDL12_02799 [Handroanthus impetiginosus]|uniref:Uncharacterized protein n=1 Tax=Handroanthus impetiginosus TaxID=429701 RepID=A0A2G9I3W0_9LAMI|nr:hypothetical protein CDL12_02799 [Handroanthus impetiginosus]
MPKKRTKYQFLGRGLISIYNGNKLLSGKGSHERTKYRANYRLHNPHASLNFNIRLHVIHLSYDDYQDAMTLLLPVIDYLQTSFSPRKPHLAIRLRKQGLPA